MIKSLCNFDAIVKGITNNSKMRKHLLRITSSALMCVILFINGAQAFHIHSQIHPKSHQNNESIVDIDAPSCSICYYISDKQSKQLNYTPDNTCLFINPETGKLFVFNFSLIPALFLPGLSNKGPPAI